MTESLKLANIDKDGKIDYKEFAKVRHRHRDTHRHRKRERERERKSPLSPSLYKIDYKEFVKV